jgi:2-keto-4-pentenoate hydratase
LHEIAGRTSTEEETGKLMSKLDVSSLAQELFAAYRNGDKVTPPTSRDPEFNLNTAYAVEAEIRRMRTDEGAVSVGRKVGYANKAVWRILKLETLVWGNMYSDTVRCAAENHASFSMDGMRSAKIEPEIVFGLREPLSGECVDAAAALRAVEWLAVGFEIIDCPYPDWKFQPADFVASFGLHAALIVGDLIKVDADLIPTLIEHLPGVGVKVFKNGEFVEEGFGKNSLRSPALCLGELSHAVANQPGALPLKSGEIISSGTLTAGHMIGRGDSWRVAAEGLPLRTLTMEIR